MARAGPVAEARSRIWWWPGCSSTAGVAALIVGVQPPLTAALAGPFLGERVTARGWLGLALGFVGVVLVVGNKLGHRLGTPIGKPRAGLDSDGSTARPHKHKHK